MVTMMRLLLHSEEVAIHTLLIPVAHLHTAQDDSQVKATIIGRSYPVVRTDAQSELSGWLTDILIPLLLNTEDILIVLLPAVMNLPHWS